MSKAISIVLLVIFIMLVVFLVAPNNNKHFKKTNPKDEPAGLSIEKLKTYKGVENITDAEAENIICSLNKYAEITFLLFQEQKINSITI